MRLTRGLFVQILAVLTLALVLAPPVLPRAAVSPGDTPADPPGIGSLTGQLLVATPDMADPRFAHTVILMVRHNKDGAFGIVINLPLDERPVADILRAVGDNDTKAEGTIRLYAGGPVDPQIGFVVHSAEYHRPETLAVDGKVAVTSSADILRDIAKHHGPAKSLFAFGYAGWGPGQLEGEMAQRSWFIAPADMALIFDEDRQKVWDAAMARRAITL